MKVYSSVVGGSLILQSCILPLCEGRQGEYPFLDAIVSSFVLSGRKAPTLSLESFLEYLECSSDNPSDLTEEKVMEQISDAIDIGLEMASQNVGRVVESIDETVQIGENHEATVKSVTLACYGIRNGVSAGIYGAEIIWDPRPDDVIGTSADPSTRNMTMVLEADVMELPLAHTLFVPKKRCFDLDSFDLGLAVSTSSTNHISFHQRIPRTTQPVTIGGTPVTFGAAAGILGIHTIDIMTKQELEELGRADYLSAYKFPKAEMVVFSRAIATCVSQDLTVGECTLLAATLAEQSNIEISSRRTSDYHEGMLNAYEQFEFLQSRVDKLSDAANEFVSSVVNFPFIFDPRFASSGKNTFATFAEASIPYHSQDEFKSRIESAFPDDYSTCENSEATAFSEFYNPALLQRSIEFEGEPSPQWSDWFVSELSAALTLPLEESDTFDKTVTWAKDSFSGRYSLQEGNLTDRRLGKTADYVVATPTNNFVSLKSMIERQQKSVDALNRASATALRGDESPPCGERATDSDIFLLVLGMAAAAAGGMQAMLGALHKTLRLMAVFGFKYESKKSISGWRTLIPTYELFLALLGVVMLVVLVIPAYLEFQTELEISGYTTSGSNMEAIFDTVPPDIVNRPPTISGGTPVLVTLVKVDTHCVSARPELLLVIVVVGTILTFLLNFPFLFRLTQTLIRYTNGLCQWQRDIPQGTSVRDSELRILNDSCEQKSGQSSVVEEVSEHPLAPAEQHPQGDNRTYVAAGNSVEVLQELGNNTKSSFAAPVTSMAPTTTVPDEPDIQQTPRITEAPPVSTPTAPKTEYPQDVSPMPTGDTQAPAYGTPAMSSMSQPVYEGQFVDNESGGYSRPTPASEHGTTYSSSDGTSTSTLQSSNAPTPRFQQVEGDVPPTSSGVVENSNRDPPAPCLSSLSVIQY